MSECEWVREREREKKQSLSSYRCNFGFIFIYMYMINMAHVLIYRHPPHPDAPGCLQLLLAEGLQESRLRGSLGVEIKIPVRRPGSGAAYLLEYGA